MVEGEYNVNLSQQCQQRRDPIIVVRFDSNAERG